MVEDDAWLSDKLGEPSRLERRASDSQAWEASRPQPRWRDAGFCVIAAVLAGGFIAGIVTATFIL